MKKLSDQAFYHFQQIVLSTLGIQRNDTIDTIMSFYYLKGLSPEQSVVEIKAMN